MKLIDEIASQIGVLIGKQPDEVNLEVANNIKFADLSTNILISSKLAKKREKELISELNSNDYIEKVEIVEPGFLNIFLNSTGKEQLLKEITVKDKDDYSDKKNQNNKVQIEYVSANPTGPLTMANGRGAFGGEALANIYELLGYKVVREYYINNLGRQSEILADSIIFIKEGSPRQYDKNDLYKGEYIKNLAAEINFSKDESLKEIGKRVADKIVENYIKPVLIDLGVEFDNWYQESQLYQDGLVEEAIRILKKKGLIYKKEEALWFKSKQLSQDSQDRVVKRANGEYTYFASDIGYVYDKFEKRKFDKVINLWGADHHGYVDRYQGMLKAFGWQERWQVIIFQLINLIDKSGQKLKMSKRKGQYVLLKDFVDEVGMDVAKFVFLSKDFNTPLDIDFKKLKSTSPDNPVYYIQYAFARINSIEKKEAKIKAQNSTKERYQFNQIESKLLLEIARFEEVIEIIKRDNNQIHLLAYYSNDLAKSFHAFYKDSPILKAPKNIREKRLVLAKAAKKTLKLCLGLMGLEAPEKM
jgi:arginyl-tRNA synthetase